MSIRERIMALGVHRLLPKAADLADARERELLAQRDELLALLIEQDEVMRIVGGITGEVPREGSLGQRVQAAIAKAEGGGA